MAQKTVTRIPTPASPATLCELRRTLDFLSCKAAKKSKWCPEEDSNLHDFHR